MLGIFKKAAGLALYGIDVSLGIPWRILNIGVKKPHMKDQGHFADGPFRTIDLLNDWAFKLPPGRTIQSDILEELGSEDAKAPCLQSTTRTTLRNHLFRRGLWDCNTISEFINTKTGERYRSVSTYYDVTLSEIFETLPRVFGNPPQDLTIKRGGTVCTTHFQTRAPANAVADGTYYKDQPEYKDFQRKNNPGQPGL